MFRLGLQLTLKSGKEALTRLMLTGVSVAIGVTILLGVFANFNALQTANNRPYWESTTATAGSKQQPSLLWNYSESVYQGKFIEQLRVAAIGQNPPHLPGMRAIPEPGTYYTSPALHTVLTRTPRNELGVRFSGNQSGIIGNKALSNPNELVVIMGYSPESLMSLPNTIRVSAIATTPIAKSQGTPPLLQRLAFGVAGIALLFPIVILIYTATRLAASRREERYAALRLIGATSRQIATIVSVDSMVSASIGSLLGLGLFLVLLPTLSHTTLLGSHYFVNTVTPKLWGYLSVLVGVPIAATVASLLSLRRVQISPLGVSRHAQPSSPRAWRILPLLVGSIMYVSAMHYNIKHAGTSNANLSLYIALLAFCVILAGLTIAGPWLTAQTAQLLGRRSRRASMLLASRRLADSPAVAFRAVSGLVLAIFIGAVVSAAVPAIIGSPQTIGASRFDNLLRVSYADPSFQQLSSAKAASLLRALGSYRDIAVVPFYALAQSPGHDSTNDSLDFDFAPTSYNSIVNCAAIKQVAVLGACAPNVTAVKFNSTPLFDTENTGKALPTIDQSNPFYSQPINRFKLRGLVIKINDAATREKVRSTLASYPPALTQDSTPDVWENGGAPETIHETNQSRVAKFARINRTVLGVVALTILVAGCSLTVAIGGSVIERKRPFALLRLSGVPVAVLYRVVLIEGMVPLLGAAVISATAGFIVAGPTVTAQWISFPPKTYFIVVGAGIVLAFLVILSVLPLLRRISTPDETRFE